LRYGQAISRDQISGILFSSASINCFKSLAISHGDFLRFFASKKHPNAISPISFLGGVSSFMFACSILYSSSNIFSRYAQTFSFICF
jgi:hypothetical protein